MSDVQKQLQELFSYDPETGLLTWSQSTNPRIKIGDAVGSATEDGYLGTRALGRKWRVHRLIWVLVYGAEPEGPIDHVNGERRDNRLCNLRVATSTENQRNRKISKNSTTGFKGVIVRPENTRRPYVAQIGLNNRQKYLGSFATAEEAHHAYCLAAQKYYGEFARAG